MMEQRLQQSMMVSTSLFHNVVTLWDMASRKRLQTLRGHSREVTSVSFSPDGTKVASGSMDRKVKIWDVKSGECVQSLDGYYSGDAV